LLHNVVVLRDITEERQLQRRIVEAEKHAYMVELVDHLIDRINPSTDEIRDQLSAISGHLFALREVIRRSQTTNPDDSSDYTELAFREIEQALHTSLENLDHVSKVVGCLDELEISTGQVARDEVGVDSKPFPGWLRK
jgi:Mg2+ and Co2+ transporter CorA